ncbi:MULTISPECIES: TetR family transcriptional regulator C-terminal domain-containing protein [Burkholderia]|uniref:Transcriptional regulator BetI n=3 Tax=Burkholderia cepacia complex TaxID=87882 RepID=A0A6J5IZ95_9BURK|nr:MULTISPECIES: TetR family transcriptional regulator C-terminal domain-containing protein [Burkholderia]MCA8292422.1 TetR family transcriptional regulator C-terminal domain-containing protein [Burkholderia sp. AU30198]UKD15030.1 TetR family transcriptional regulator C-terminal domain-containing protein [Burkholderia aenigmatica]CAB3964222.1 transcriptional regulator BetI [Burkholderia aenigmatica]VWB05985.1 transcriptional regulator BetI [Burkholderia lata]VWB09546.1 transcriptional regulato
MKKTPGSAPVQTRGRGIRETPAVRQQSIIDATMRCIARYSYSETTIDRICAEAKVSRGLINHHFQSKDELMAQTYKRLASDLLDVSRAAAANATGPEDKLDAIIKVCFAAPVFAPKNVKVWLGFWSVAHSDPVIRKAHKELYAGYRQALKKLFDQIAEVRGGTVDSDLAALTLTAVIDGFWLELARDPTSFTAEDALTSCLRVVDTFLPPPKTARKRA